MLQDETKTRIISLVEALAASGDVAADVSPYSGRGMYGRQCLSLKGEYLDPFTLAIEMVRLAPSFNLNPLDIPSPSSDSLGRGVVLYWPDIRYPFGAVLNGR